MANFAANQVYQLARYTTLFTYLTLLALYLVWCWQYGPVEIAAKLVLWLIICSGLLLVAPGLLRAKRRSHQWLCFILLIYFVWAIQSLFTQQLDAESQFSLDGLGVLQLLAVIICFVSAMLTVRWEVASDN